MSMLSRKQAAMTLTSSPQSTSMPFLSQGKEATQQWTMWHPRLDLLRAVMVGPADTPYHDGLFFFDIKLPPNYPASPPQVLLLLATQ